MVGLKNPDNPNCIRLSQRTQDQVCETFPWNATWMLTYKSRFCGTAQTRV